jgi:hypothetical protein
MGSLEEGRGCGSYKRGVDAAQEERRRRSIEPIVMIPQPRSYGGDI